MIGYRIVRLDDAGRRRPVLLDVWYPCASGAVETEHDYGMARGRVAENAAPEAARHPLVLLSHGAFGSARNYSWAAEHLARRGFVVVGVSHFRESPAYGPETIDPLFALQPWHRTRDCSFALDRVLAPDLFGQLVDPGRIGALGHSSGGATAIALGGARFDLAAMVRYCASVAARGDKGCAYASTGGPALSPPPESSADHRNDRIRAIVALDPALGPGHDPAGVTVPVHLVGSVDNDFLPFEAHAGRYARLIPGASLTRLDHGEGHFVYLDPCTWDREANGVPLCRDRPGVERGRVHAMLQPVIARFFEEHLRGP